MQSVAAELVALFAEVLPRLARITLFITAGVFLANVAVAFGLVRYVAGVSGWLTRPANLPDEVGTAILTTAASTTAGYATLAEYRESGFLDDRATLVAVVINTFFGFVQHVFTYYAPVLIPILGWSTGVLYVSFRAGIALAITLTGVVLGGLLLSDRNVNRRALADVAAERPAGDDRSARERVRAAAGKSWTTLRRIVPRLAAVYTLVVAFVTRYDVESLTGFAEPVTAALGLPGAAVPVIAVYTLDTTAGAVTIAPLLDDVFTPRTAVATLLVGGIVSFAVSTFKRSIPFQYGIWGAEFGTKVIVVNTALKVVFISLSVLLLLVPLR
ncbi:nucleoside recognition protein [Halorubrum sp. JWXQ-INN 858]|uniref:nucleoside recognition protein n=1 Tax=Halorubrum sp. JWXQ-INN 858 TaxID=2690782 RepID=UPI0013FA36CF|nr:nucleoside recognition protein [Halorubrum sp. JWXQ-INN 858]MWV64869.1 nucleoside recognition protein [Halorubrum sp. JWXQ-INN 858]